MPTPLENELGLGPTTHRIRRWFRNLLSRLGKGSLPQDRRSLDPLTVNYEAWREVRRTVREWPHYKEAANSLEVLVSPEDWDEYWGIDAARKEAGIATYVRSMAARKGYWIAGVPQVTVVSDDAVEIGEVEVACQFVEPEGGVEPEPISNTAAREPLDEALRAYPAHPAPRTMPAEQAAPQEAPAHQDTMRFVDKNDAGEVYLSDANGFRLVLRAGDCIGAVNEGDVVPPEVNVRLDARGFPYAEVKQCSLSIVDGRWAITNHATHGTMLVLAQGGRLMLSEPEPYPLQEGDVVYLGPKRPLRFECA